MQYCLLIEKWALRIKIDEDHQAEQWELIHTIYYMRRIGPSIDPCATPQVNLKCEDLSTNWNLPVK